MNNLRQKAGNAEKSTRTYFKKMKKNKIAELDKVIGSIHSDIFRKINCLECANCCRSLGPRLTNRDIELIAKTLRKKPADVIESFLKIDEDHDYVFREMPCPFLGADNYCSIYENRPKACREYPHTDRSKFYQIYSLTIRNAETCPAVYEILERLKKEFPV